MPPAAKGFALGSLFASGVQGVHPLHPARFLERKRGKELLKKDGKCLPSSFGYI